MIRSKNDWLENFNVTPIKDIPFLIPNVLIISKELNLCPQRQ